MHKNWCGHPCAECQCSCELDETIPCSMDCTIEDLLSRMEITEISATPEEQETIRAMVDIAERIKQRLFNCDSFWDYYWQAVDDVTKDILSEIRKTNQA